jgi:hypothetical protein
MLKKIVSGGQTGVDRGALDAALSLHFPCGGWCPEGRMAEDGAIAARYPLRELPGGDYDARTAANVRDSDGTLIIHFGEVAGGTRLALEECRRRGRQCQLIDAAALDVKQAGAIAAEFVRTAGVEVLNVAGPRESGAPGAAEYAFGVVRGLLHDGRSRLEGRRR